MTKDGFMLLVMGYTGEKAMQVKIAFLAAFNAMSDYIKQTSRRAWQELLAAEAALKAQEQIGSFHGRGLCQHKYAKRIKQGVRDRLQADLQYQLPLV